MRGDFDRAGRVRCTGFFARPFRLVAMLGLAFAFAPACRPRNVDSHAANLAESGEDCSRILTEEREIALVRDAGKLSRRVLAGELSIDTRNREVDAMLADFSGGREGGAARALIAQTNDLVSSGWVLSLLLASDSTVAPVLNETQFRVLESMGVARSLAPAYMSDLSDWLLPFYRTVREYGFRYDARGGWTFTEPQGDGSGGLHVDAFRRTPELSAAFMSLFATGVTAALADGERRDTVVIDSIAFLPPRQDGSIAIWTKSRWDEVVRRNLKYLETETERFIKATKEASSYSNLMRGRIIEWFGGERGHQGKTAPEIEAEGAYKILLQATAKLSGELGTGKEMRERMFAMRRSLLEIESEQLKAGLEKLKAAERAAIAAPFVPVLIWAAPYAGAAMAPTWAATIGNASATAALMPLAFAAGSAAVSATIKSATVGGGFLCNLYNDYTSKGADALFAAPFMAALPSVGALGAASVATVSGGAVCAGTAYGTFNLTLSVIGIKAMAEAGIKSVGTCYEHVLAAETAGKAGNGQLVNAEFSKAVQSCVDAGISLTFAAMQTGKLSRRAVQAIREKNLKPLLGTNCLKLAGNGDCAPSAQREEKKPPAGAAEIAPLTKDSGRLHRNVSVGERYDVIREVPLEMTASAPGHDYLRKPDNVVAMGQQIAASSDKGLAMFQGKDKMTINIYTDAQARVTGIEVTDGNHRFAAGMYAERLAPGKGWKTIGDIPAEFLDIRVNGFNTNGQKLPRWVPLYTVAEGSFPQGSWREIPPEWGAKGPTAEIAGDVASTSSWFRPEHRGVSIMQVLQTSMRRIGVELP